jgi:sugar/nucleoside kinase (ribokinase family)
VDVVGLGLAALDVVFRLKAMPTWKSAPGFSDFGIYGGGMTGTAMVAASRLGVAAGYMGTAGTDSLGDLKVAGLAEEGVDVSRIVRRQGRETQIIAVYVRETDGERIFSSFRKPGELLRPEELDREYITSADYLLVDGCHFDAAVTAARWMKEAGKCVVLDAGKTSGSVSKAVSRLVREADVLISGAGFVEALSGKSDLPTACRRVLKEGPRIVVQTGGAKGCYTATREAGFQLPAFDAEVVDTTGAGDTFHGAYVVGLLRGWSAREIALFSMAAAALKCRKLGGRAGIPTFDEVMHFLRERGERIEDKKWR